MTDTDKGTVIQAVIEAIKADPEVVHGDGHTIYDPEFYTKRGIPKAFVEVLAFNHKSHGDDPKHRLYQNGREVASVWGVYNLDFLSRVADVVGADTRTANKKLGRGFRAQALRDAIYEKLDLYEALMPDGTRTAWDERLRTAGARRVVRGT